MDLYIWLHFFSHNIRSFLSFWNNYISLWEWLLIFLLDGIAFGLLMNHTLYFWLLSLFPSQILVCATSFYSSISLYIWRITFGELFLAKTKKIKSGKIYKHKSMHVSRSTKPFPNHSWQVWRSIYNSHIDFKSSSIVIRVLRNKLRS